ncbi:MAG TPA: trypsin-like peptidase domain-containing protein [Candidatus Saccharimonadales bacterium]|nr:trypsin-like peptidase domain-containing protein [Candidatus Saccharimonadales bacterium]
MPKPDNPEASTPQPRSVSSRQSKTVSFTVPSLPHPNFGAVVHKRWPAGALATAFILTAVISGYGGAWLENHGSQNNLSGNSFAGQKQIVTSQSQLISRIAKTVSPSVVSVNVSISDSGGGFGLFGFSQPEEEQAAGTGIIISSGGLIVTNRHVVPQGTTNVSVTLSDGTELKNVSVLGRTNSSDSLDIAFLKINDAKGHKLEPAALGDSSKLSIGDNVVAIGNALGQFQNTVTSGIISGYGRSVQAGDSSGFSSTTENLDDLFQTDAAINEGNSGGPLVNLNGQVIAINTALASDSQNIGFAIPINDVKGLIEQVTKNGKLSRPYLGVRYLPLTSDVANEYGLSVQNGAFIAPTDDPNNPSVLKGSPADKAGLKERDIITQFDGVKIDQNHSLTGLLDQHQPGDKINLTVIRGSSTKHVTVRLGTLPSDNQ